jgi:hypothetical protein
MPERAMFRFSFTRRRFSFTRRRLVPVVALAGLLVALAGTPAHAASAPTGIYAGMDNCPLTAPAMKDPTNLQVGCVISVTRGGSVAIGTTTVPLTSPITLQFGAYWPASAPVLTFPDGSSANVYNTVAPLHAPELSADPLQVPIPGIANIIPGVTSVFAQVELVGPITSFVPLAVGESTPAFVMPVRLHLLNALLGLTCYVGSASHPLTLRPTTGTTSPPPPNQPISGDPGVIGVDPDPNGFQSVVASFTGATLVDNTVSAPGATGCGLFDTLDLLVNSAFGVPSASGHNTVTFSQTNTSLAIDGTIQDLSAALRASAQ